jgi:hypothetical protein
MRAHAGVPDASGSERLQRSGSRSTALTASTRQGSSRRRQQPCARGQAITLPLVTPSLTAGLEAVAAVVLFAWARGAGLCRKLQLVLEQGAERAPECGDAAFHGPEVIFIASPRKVGRDADVDGIGALVGQRWDGGRVVEEPGVYAWAGRARTCSSGTAVLRRRRGPPRCPFARSYPAAWASKAG